MVENREWDATTVVGGLLAFTLPLTLLIPNFSVWSLIPKVQVTRFHLVSGTLTWPQLNVVIIGLLFVLFCLYLEIKKRKLDEIVERAMRASQEADRAANIETKNQAEALRACVEMLDASSEHYEHLAMLRDELRRREFEAKQHPPTIESSQDM